MNGKKKLLVIINPISGVGKQRTVEKALTSYLDHNSYDYEIEYTQYAHHAQSIAKEACESGRCHIIVAVGGDGSVNDVASGIVAAQSDMPMAIIPCGSGNGLARHLKIPLTVKKAIEVINTGYCQKIDTITMNGHTYVSIAGIGFDALVAHKFSTTQTRGLQAYTEVILSEYPFYKPSLYKLNIDGKEMEREALFISFANSNQFGYNTVVAPSANLSDGLIDVCIVDLIPIIHLPIIAHLVLARKFDLSKHVEIIKAKSIKIYNNDYEWVNLDGEAVKMGKEIDININNKKLNIICPHGKEK